MKLLHIDSSILGDNSVSRRLSAGIVAKLREAHPDVTVTTRDLAATPIAHLSGAYLGAAQAAAGQHSPALQEDLASSEAALEDFMTADVVVIGAPMYNFAIPSQLKAWIDRLLVAGKTFRYTATGVEGLAGGRRVIVASSRGGAYSDGPMTAMDHQEAYLRGVFGFIGLPDIEIVRAEGLAMGDETKAKAIASAEQTIAAMSAA
ncbi:FMN-dependent NADH-azoreductase [Lichenihabitans psoromatis]|uniref:FMN-dependent NADH-azoreductase n=1 Tax=Lichenihabitans psoromatis TaxID=2528642 RepID=UPI0010385A65|nr:FMN-dependent NADH-azoreductase [Lichenihabitans psoromatis]